jgi:diguanylate cyclase (GGDEF)-like protein/PAS domain S-box-containing protein
VPGHCQGQPWLDSLPDPTIGVDRGDSLQWANRAAVDLFGWPVADFLGRSVLDLVHPDDLPFALMSLDSVKTKEVGTVIEVRVQTAGGWRMVETIGSNRLDDEQIGCVVLTLRDGTARRRWELGRSDDAVFRSIVNNAATLLVLMDPDGTISGVSAAVTRMLGLDPESLEGRQFQSLVCVPDREAFRSALLACRGIPAGSLEPMTLEVGLIGRDKRVVPFELTLVDMADDPTVTGIVMSGHNITKLRLFQKALADLALKDPLTMLPNRTAVDDRLEFLLGQGESVKVAFVDLDGFKTLNDRYGHQVGDLVLRAVAERLRAAAAPGDLVARYGGDEFVVVSAEAGGDVRFLSERLSGAVCRPLDDSGRQLSVSASIGVAQSVDGDTPADVLSRADRAMYLAKGHRRRPAAQPAG